MVGLTFKVWYRCHDCGKDFFLMQGDPEPDDDVCLCWDCIDIIIRRDRD